MDKKFKFPKKLRLLTPEQFAFVFQKPQRAGTSEIVILGCFNSLDYPRIGFAISKKCVKRAHERNRIKRVTRESFRLCQHELPAMDFVILARKGIENLDNITLTEFLRKLWHYYYRSARIF